MKREAWKIRDVQNNNTVSNEKPIVVKENSEEDSVEQDVKGLESSPLCVVDEPSPTYDPDHGECVHTSLCKTDKQLSNSTFSEETTDEECKNIELEEKEEGFIGPRLPRMMTDEEVKALFKNLLGDKYG